MFGVYGDRTPGDFSSSVSLITGVPSRVSLEIVVHTSFHGTHVMNNVAPLPTDVPDENPLLTTQFLYSG